MKQTMLFGIAAVMAVLLAGCKDELAQAAMPKVNDENCKLENIKKIEDRAIREKFSGLCLRAGDFKPSDERSWEPGTMPNSPGGESQ